MGEGTCSSCLTSALAKELAGNVSCVCSMSIKCPRLCTVANILLFGAPGGLLARSYIGGPDIMLPFLSAPLKKPPDAGTGTALSPAPLRELL